MDEVIEQRPSIRPLVLISSLPEDTPEPSAAVGDQNESDEKESQQPTTGRKEKEKRKRNRDNKVLDLIRKDMRQQRKAEERRAQESRQRRETLFSLPER